MTKNGDTRQLALRGSMAYIGTRECVPQKRKSGSCTVGQKVVSFGGADANTANSISTEWAVRSPNPVVSTQKKATSTALKIVVYWLYTELFLIIFLLHNFEVV